MSAAPIASHGSTLIAIARAAIMAATTPRPAAWGEAWLREPGASFVTLKLEGELRGCIGAIEPHRALGDDVAYNAYAAAYRDPRFDPVGERERARLQVEVSVLSPREPLAVGSEQEALSALRPGVDGVVLEYGGLGATFLPQVWESLPQPAEFLDHLRRKAGLPGGFWHPDLRLSRYTVEKYT
jgi:AmmeMemoRadiSam system protein A